MERLRGLAFVVVVLAGLVGGAAGEGGAGALATVATAAAPAPVPATAATAAAPVTAPATATVATATAATAAATDASSAATVGAPAALAVELRREKKPAHDTCDEHLLTQKILWECKDKSSPNAHCCIAVVAAVDIRGCLCSLAIDSTFVDAGESMTPHDVMRMYGACGGMRRLPSSVDAACNGDASPRPCHLTRKDEGLLMGIDVLQLLEDAALVLMLLDKAWEYLKARRSRRAQAQQGAALVV